MQSRKHQRGVGWFGLMFIFGTIAIVSIVTIKSFPVYMNEMKIKRAVSRVAADPELASAEALGVRRALSRYWDIESIDSLGFDDVKLVRTDRGKVLQYDYQVVVPLFYNVSLLFDFQGEHSMTRAG